MKSNRQKSEKNLSADLETFGKLPTKTREALLLGENSEKTIGKESLAIDKKIMQRSWSAKT